jgi:hypothetical protein
MRTVPLVCGLVALSLGYLRAQSQIPKDSIYLGSERLALGMPKDPVITNLSAIYDVRPVGEEKVSSWLVSTRSGPPFTYLGNVVFKDGKLNTVLKDWGPEDSEKGVGLATALYAVLDGFSQEGRRDCEVTVGQQHEPGFDGKTISISCGNKGLTIDLRDSDKMGRSANITEILQAK